MTRRVQVFLGGEGANELGGWSGPASYRDPGALGAVEALLRRVEAEGWEVCGALEWRRIRKFTVGGRGIHADTKNVMALTLHAKEARADAVTFMRDRDGDEGRVEAIRRGIERAKTDFPDAPPVIGGVAVPKLEGWIAAMLGERDPDVLSPGRADKALTKHGVAAKDGAAMVEAIAAANLEAATARSPSLAAWVGRAREVLSPLVASKG